MITARLLVVLLASALAIGGVTAAIADDGDEETSAFEAVDLRKDDAGADVELVDDEQDDDPTGDRDKTRGDDDTNQGHNHDRDATGGDDGTAGGDNSDGDRTAGDDGTGLGNNHDGDATAGDDASAGGDNSEVAVAPEPAPAPVYDDYSDDDGYAYGGSD
jgi:hypothetical protein